MKNYIIPALGNSTGESLSEYLTASVNAFSEITGIPVTFFNLNNDIVQEFRKDDKICNIFHVYNREESACRRNLTSAGQLASSLGEPYIFLCKSGLINIAVSLIENEELIGCFVAGPIVMGKLRSSTMESFCTLNRLDEVGCSVAKMFAGQMRVYQPDEVHQLALLLYNSVVSSISVNHDYSALRNQYRELSKVNTDIQNRKKERIGVEYPYDLEKLLIDHVSNGQVYPAKESINKLLNSFSVLEAGDLNGIKAKALWLFAIITRIAGENDSTLGEIIDADLDVINRISEAEDFMELCQVCEALSELIAGNVMTSIYSGHSQIVIQALRFINRNYKNKITLKDIEDNLHVNSSYFSTLFKQEMGQTFTDYLNSLRIKYACQLLADTNLSIIDVSLSTGFEDQSYFTKVFKKATGMTPKVYRATCIKKEKG